MIWKLSDRVWWGDRFSITEEKVGAVLNVAHNLNFHPQDYDPDYDFLKLCETVPYVRLSRDDYLEVDIHYMNAINKALDLFYYMGNYPILIHCWEGRHRSPAMAMYTELYLRKVDSGKKLPTHSLRELKDRVGELRPNFVELEYSKSLQRYIKQNLLIE